MCLAEALLRIPDAGTVDRLIRDKIAGADWQHASRAFRLAVRQRLDLGVDADRTAVAARPPGPPGEADLGSVLRRLIARSSEPLWRQAVTGAMGILADQFITGRTIEEALQRARPAERQGYRHSFDMLGEAARTAADAAGYRAAYERAIAAIGRHAAGQDIAAAPGISVKLSALHPRYEMAQQDRAMRELLPSLLGLARAGARSRHRLHDRRRGGRPARIVARSRRGAGVAPDLAGWDGLGLAVQAYQKRALPLIDWLADLAARAHRRLMVRLVKGAYWDSEIKRAQERGLDDLPGIHPQGCDRRLLSRLRQANVRRRRRRSSRNSRPITRTRWRRCSNWRGDPHRLGVSAAARHGRGALRRGGRRRQDRPAVPDLCPGRQPRGPARLSGAAAAGKRRQHLVRQPPGRRSARRSTRSSPTRSPGWRGCRSSRTPASRCRRTCSGRHAGTRAGIDLADPRALAALRERACRGGAAAVARRPDRRRRSSWPEPIVRCSIRATAGAKSARSAMPTPTRSSRRSSRAVRAAPAWDATPAEARAAALERAADLYERHRAALMALIVREGGRTSRRPCRRCAKRRLSCAITPARARADFAGPERLPGPTGERNELALHGRGVFACISPWNFPLAIFTGQVAAALAAGNAVVAKPAEQTPLVAAAAVRRLLAAGIPGRRAASVARLRRERRRRAHRRSAHRRRRLHRLDRDGARDQPRARPPLRADRAARSPRPAGRTR